MTIHTLAGQLLALVLPFGPHAAQDVGPQPVLKAEQAAKMPTPRERPARARDPFVFRSVLDKHVRTVTLALNEEMWAAWDTTRCGLYKAWKGGVKLDGAVYTMAHGPQPTVQGVTYVDGLAGDVWSADVGGKPAVVRAAWRGYRIEHGACVLLYEIALEDGRRIAVEERPEYARPEDLFPPDRMEDFGLEPGLPGLVRRFHAPAVPEGVVIAVRVRSDAPRGRFIDAGGAQREQLVDVKDAEGQIVGTEIHSQIWLNAQRKVNSLTQFFDPVVLPPPPPEAAAPAPSGSPPAKDQPPRAGVPGGSGGGAPR